MVMLTLKLKMDVVIYKRNMQILDDQFHDHYNAPMASVTMFIMFTACAFQLHCYACHHVNDSTFFARRPPM